MRVEPSDDYLKRRADSFDLELPWGLILAALVVVCLVLDRAGVWVVK